MRPRAAGRLAFRSAADQSPTTGELGRFDVPVPGGPSAAAYVPDTGGAPLRLVVMLHGAGGIASRTLELLREHADERRLLLVAPKSVGATWDVIQGGFGPDVENLDEVLRGMIAAYPVRGLTIGGFSDGASYALSLGITNGDVFDSVIAFSPGFSAARTAHGRPRFFVSHGVDDEVLPIDRCSRRIVPLLRDSRYEVEYREFEGGHSVPPDIRDDAVEWLAQE